MTFDYIDSAVEPADVAQGYEIPHRTLLMTHGALRGPLLVKSFTTRVDSCATPGRNLYYAVQHAYTILPFPFRRSGSSPLCPREAQPPLSSNLTLDPKTPAKRYSVSTIASNCETIFIPRRPDLTESE